MYKIKNNLSVSEKILSKYKVDYMQSKSDNFLYINTNGLNNELLCEELSKRKITTKKFNHRNIKISLIESEANIKRIMLEIASLIGQERTPFQKRS